MVLACSQGRDWSRGRTFSASSPFAYSRPRSQTLENPVSEETLAPKCFFPEDEVVIPQSATEPYRLRYPQTKLREHSQKLEGGVCKVL